MQCSAYFRTSQAATGRSFTTGLRGSPISRRAACVCAAFAEGARVKVAKEVKVYHVPKLGEGFNLEGLEGIIDKDVSQFNGKTLSTTAPYRVKFVVEQEGSSVKVLAHLAPEELEVVN